MSIDLNTLVNIGEVFRMIQYNHSSNLFFRVRSSPVKSCVSGGGVFGYLSL